MRSKKRRGAEHVEACGPLSSTIQSFADKHRLKIRVGVDDGCRIFPGKYGHIYEYDDYRLGVMVMPDPPRKRYWGCVRLALLKAGFALLQDGDGEGAAVFDAQNPKQAKAAIRVAGIKSKRVVSNQRREQLVASLRLAQEGHLAMQESLE